MLSRCVCLRPTVDKGCTELRDLGKAVCGKGRGHTSHWVAVRWRGDFFDRLLSQNLKRISTVVIGSTPRIHRTPSEEVAQGVGVGQSMEELSQAGTDACCALMTWVPPDTAHMQRVTARMTGSGTSVLATVAGSC